MKFRNLSLSHIEELKELLDSTKNGMEKHTIAPEVVYKNIGKVLSKIEQIELLIKRETQSV